MTIKEIELFNFRIYKGSNLIDLSNIEDKNIFVVSGRNGFGKTTFLMSLVWCLYGRQMQDVDDIYKKEIDEDIKKQETKRSKCISIKDVVKNAISNGIATEQVAQMDRAQNTLSNERNIERE